MKRKFFEDTYRRFWDRLEELKTPPYQSNSYAICDRIGQADWRTPGADMMISGELSESINGLNAWCKSLVDLEVWSGILTDFDETDGWNLRSHFVEATVHFCMFQPSSTRDRLGQVATNGLHQANLTVVADYKDVLDQDTLKPGRFLKRNEVERQLARIGKHWGCADQLLTALQCLDSVNHRQRTIDYRNRASHFIAPRLELGEVQFVTRDIVPATRMAKQPDGYYRVEEIEGKKAVSYGFGGIRPLSLTEIIETNSREYRFAVAALDAYSDLLREVLARMTECQKTEGR